MKKLLCVLFVLLFPVMVFAEMHDVVEDTDEWFPVVLIGSNDGLVETGLAYDDIVVEFSDQGAVAWQAYTESSSNWKEAGNGLYWVQIGASEFSDAGYRYAVKVSGATINTEFFFVKVEPDVPTTTEFNARTLPSADYVVVGDTIAGVTLVTTTTTNSDMITAATVNSEMVDVMTVDTLDELSVAVPAATPTFETATMLQYMQLRNKTETTGSEYRITNNAGTVISEQNIADDGTTFTRDEFGAVD